MEKLDPDLITAPDGKIAERFEALSKSSVATVVGFDIYKYSEYPLIAQTLIPALMENVIARTRKYTVGFNPFLFQRYPTEAEVFSKYIDTGDGGFFILDNPLEALNFVFHLAMQIRTHNSQYKTNQVYQHIGEINLRYAITHDFVYEYGGKFYGKGIINCARILSKDKLNRLLIDQNVHSWYLDNFIGIENVPNISRKSLSKSQHFSGYQFSVDGKELIIAKPEILNIARVTELKLRQTNEKNTALDIYAIHLEGSIVDEPGSDQRVTFNVGNMNTEGLV